MTLRLVPPDGAGQGPDEEPPCPASPTDGEALENRVVLQRLADRLMYIGRPGSGLEDTPERGTVVVVFDDDVLPELVGLLYRRQP